MSPASAYPGALVVPVHSRAMTLSDPRRLLILTEGQFRAHNAKTAMGVIRYGTDIVVALLDSSIAGRNVSDWLPGHDIPAVGTLGRSEERRVGKECRL